MGETKIQWTDYTFNPWWGCVEVSPACDHCYARTFAHRLGTELWGHKAPRRFFGDHHWNGPHRWNHIAEKAGERRRVFCASMADVFEDREDLIPHRDRLWRLIEETPALDWLLLTKRPGNIQRFAGAGWSGGLNSPPNVWFGTTVENRTHGLPRMELLRQLPLFRTTVEDGLSRTSIKFVSIEPLLEDLGDIAFDGIDWVIIGGESGHHARLFNLAWARKLIAQARRDGAAPFMKQLGARPVGPDPCLVGMLDKKGGTPIEWPEDIRVREFPG